MRRFRYRRSPRYSELVVVDQCVASGSNFLVALLIGRWLGPADLGIFAVAFAIWLVVFGIFAAAIEDPMAVFGDHSREKVGMVLEAAVFAGLLLGLILIAIAGAGFLTGSSYSGSLVVLGIGVPALLIQDFWRRLAFLRRQPERAIANDVAFLIAEIVALASLHLTHRITPATATAGWAAGGVVGALLGFFQFKMDLRVVPRAGTYLRRTVRLSGWIVLDFVVNRGVRQATLFVIAAIAGSAVLGGIQASYNLLGFTNVIILGVASATLAEGSRVLTRDGIAAMRRSVARSSFLLVTSVAICCGAFALLGGPILRLAYGEEFDRYTRLAPLVALQVVVASLQTSPDIELRLVRETRALFWSRALLAPLALGLAAVLTARFGDYGAAAGGVVVAAGLAGGGWAARALTRRRARLGDTSCTRRSDIGPS